MTAQPDEALVQQLAEVISDLTYRGREVTPAYAVHLSRAVLASGLVVPRTAVLALADAHTHEASFDCTERCDGRQEVAAELRALAGGEP